MPEAAAVTRSLLVGKRLDRYNRVQTVLGAGEQGHLEYADPATETPRLGDVEVWELYNDTLAAHPVHLRLVSFDVLDRAPVAQRDPITGALHNITVGPRRPPADYERGPRTPSSPTPARSPASAPASAGPATTSDTATPCPAKTTR